MEKETYNVDTYCINCKDYDNYYIPKGIKAEDFLKDLECKFCKVKGEIIVEPK
jgi:hypothetical protein